MCDVVFVEKEHTGMDECKNKLTSNADSTTLPKTAQTWHGSKSEFDGVVRKELRFADVEGLPIAVTHVFRRSNSSDSINTTNSDEYAASSTMLQQWGTRSLPASLANLRKPLPTKKLRFEQRQPTSSPDFIRTLQRHLVKLENVLIKEEMSIYGTIRVRNIGYEKHVTVRYSSDDWKASHDISAEYVMQSCDGPTDRFCFTISINEDYPVGSRVQFAVRFQASGGDFWDNNAGKNYSAICEEIKRSPASSRLAGE